MTERLISDLINVPERVLKGDFVLNLSKGVTEPEKTVADYVVTPQLVKCFEDALAFIRSSVDAGNSKACYLHGSFGSGKSHFMAVLHLLLEHNQAVRSIPELAGVCEKNRWVEDKKFLLVPYHMIGARSMEAAILGGYVDHTRSLHPDSPLPGVYLAEKIFDNAVQVRNHMGDEKFFNALNNGGSGSSGGAWGRLEGWNAERFEAALKEKPRSVDRSRLVGKLVETIFPAFQGIAQGTDEAFVDLDDGLAIISEHAKSLGYDGLILFLDELILWLATHSADLNFVQTEGNKLAKLVESRNADRPTPIISFVARQRDLRELIGEGVTGFGQVNFSDVLSHWEGRFHKITLEDRNLPLIAQKRVLRPKNEACKAELDEAFEQTSKIRQEIMEILLTREADRAMFRMVYPFTPALIQTLIAVSSALQRERTALKIMLQLLVNRRETLRLGEVIPVGDLWDVVSLGDEAFSDVMRVRLDNAKKLYQNKLRPMLEEQHQIDLEVDESRAKNDSNLADRLKRFENDARLIKSVLLASLVQGVDTLSNMTCRRLAALNHGTIKSRIEGREHQNVLEKLRTWASHCGEIRLEGNALDPLVSVELEGVDTTTLIEAARAYDNIGTRFSRLRGMLIAALGVPDRDEMFIRYDFNWRGSARSCEVLFANIRDLPDQTFRSQEDWKVIIGYPFDTESGSSASDALDRLNAFRDKDEESKTLVWAPRFFSDRSKSELGTLVVIESLLRGNLLESYSTHMSAQDRETARMLLKNQQSALQSRLTQVVEAAYAIRNEPPPGSLDDSIDFSESQFQSLETSFIPRKPVGASMKEALEHLLDQALSHQFPKHPKFEQEIKRGRDLEQVLAVCKQAVQTNDGRVFVEDKSVRLKLRNICDPLELGKMSETHFVLDSFWKNHFNRMLDKEGIRRPTVVDLRRLMDQPVSRGLPFEIANLLILVYADQTNRTFLRFGAPYAPDLSNMPDDIELLERKLPDLGEWTTAIGRVSEFFGHAISTHLNSSNLSDFATKVGASLKELKEPNERLVDRLRNALGALGTRDEEIASANRVRTAQAVRSLLLACDGKEPSDLVGAIARAKVDTSAAAMGRSFKSAQDVLNLLKNTKWDLFKGISRLDDDRKESADLLLQDVKSWLTADEYATAGGLKSKLDDAEKRAVALLTPPSKPKISPEPTGSTARPSPPPPRPEPPRSEPSRPGWRRVGSESKARLEHQESLIVARSLVERLEENTKLRLTIDWTLEEESE